jgi:chromosome partitioning protein
MHVVALATQKGGTGKSSLAVSLAVAARERGLKVFVLDMDPQGTARNWYQRRKNPHPQVATIEWSRLPAALERLRATGCNLVFIDTPGVDAPAATASLQEADLCLIPARPSIVDIEATIPTVRSLTKLGRPFAFVLTQCPSGSTPRASDAYRALQLDGAVADTAIAMRVDHIDALARGLGVTERNPTGKAAAETRDLLQWVLTRMRSNWSHEESARVA